VEIEIIAEIAQGYEGNSKLAELLLKGAIVANADAIKLQLVFADELCVPSYPYYDLFKSLEMDEEVWDKLVAMAHDAGKKLYFDVYGDRSLHLAQKLGADGVKISTTDFYNFPLIKQAFTTFDVVFLSTGGVPVEDIDELLAKFILPKRLVLMHGFQAEPTEIADNNLARMTTLQTRYPHLKIGFMDHSVGSGMDAFYLPLVALGLGVQCIEKHITLDYSLQIEDYISALSIDRFSEFVKIIHTMTPSLGSADLQLTSKEIDYKKRAGKVVVANRTLNKGDRISENDIAMKRVSTTPSENYFRQASFVLGQTLLNPMVEDQPFEKGMLQ
jgi:N,N'-diacetyllegionaminate synthase